MSCLRGDLSFLKMLKEGIETSGETLEKGNASLKTIMGSMRLRKEAQRMVQYHLGRLGEDPSIVLHVLKTIQSYSPGLVYIVCVSKTDVKDEPCLNYPILEGARVPILLAIKLVGVNLKAPMWPYKEFRMLAAVNYLPRYDICVNFPIIMKFLIFPNTALFGKKLIEDDSSVTVGFVTELANYDLAHIDASFEAHKSILTQIFMAMHAMNFTLHKFHNDLHEGNVLINNLSIEKEFVYKFNVLGGEYILCFRSRVLAKLWDFETATTIVSASPDTEGLNAFEQTINNLEREFPEKEYGILLKLEKFIQEFDFLSVKRLEFQNKSDKHVFRGTKDSMYSNEEILKMAVEEMRHVGGLSLPSKSRLRPGNTSIAMEEFAALARVMTICILDSDTFKLYISQPRDRDRDRDISKPKPSRSQSVVELCVSVLDSLTSNMDFKTNLAKPLQMRELHTFNIYSPHVIFSNIRKLEKHEWKSINNVCKKPFMKSRPLDTAITGLTFYNMEFDD